MNSRSATGLIILEETISAARNGSNLTLALASVGSDETKGGPARRHKEFEASIDFRIGWPV